MQTITSTGNATSYSVGAALDDLSLVHACKQGDVNAFDQIVKRYDNKLFRVAQHITHNREDAEDAVQNAFLNAFRNLRSFQEKSQFSTWLFRIATHLALNSLRDGRNERLQERLDDDSNDRREVPIVQDSEQPTAVRPLEVADWAPNPEQVYGAFELRNILRSQLQQLLPSLRVAFILRDIEGLSSEETAEVLDTTVDAVKTRLWRARLKLRQLLTRYFRVGMTRTEMSSAERGQTGTIDNSTF